MKKIILSVTFISLLFTGVSFAKGNSHRPCREDMEKFCKDTMTSGGHRMQCLKDHKDELSEQCRNHLMKKKEKRNR